MNLFESLVLLMVGNAVIMIVVWSYWNYIRLKQWLDEGGTVKDFIEKRIEYWREQ